MTNSFYAFININKLISEALKIVKKSTAPEVFDDSKIIGKIKNTSVVKSSHTNDKRGERQRDEGLDNAAIMNIISRGFKKLEDNYNALIYKDSDGKFNNLVLFFDKKANVITIVTIIQQNRTRPNYFTKDTDNKIIIEHSEINLIKLF